MEKWCLPGVTLSVSHMSNRLHVVCLPSVDFLCGGDWPGCYPLTAVTMRLAEVGELVVSVLVWGLVSRQGLRAGCVNSASHEHLLEVTLSVLQRAEQRRGALKVPFLWAACPVLMAASCFVEKPLAQHIAILTPPSLWISPPANLILSLSTNPPSPEPRAQRIIRFHIYTQQNHPERNHSLSLMLHYVNAQSEPFSSIRGS